MTPLSLTSTPSGKLHLLPDVQISGISHLGCRVRKGIVANDSNVFVSFVTLNFFALRPQQDCWWLLVMQLSITLYQMPL